MLCALRSLPRSLVPQTFQQVSVGSSSQVRNYAAKGQGKKSSQPGRGQAVGFKRSNRAKNAAAAGYTKVKREKRLGSFRPLPVNQLKENPIFETEHRTELDLPTFHPEVLTERLALGKAMKFTTSDNDAIRIYGVPKNLLVDFRVLSNPYSVVRDVTLKTVDRLDAASEKPSQETRLVFTGPSGCGKSYTLLQAVKYCTSKNWIVLYIPRSVTLVNSSTSYAYDARTRTYQQHTFSYQILQRFLTVNSPALQQLKTTKEFAPERLPAGTPLADLLNVGLKDQTLAPTVLSALMEEIARQNTYPVLLAVDELQALYRPTTLYKNPRFESIKPYHLSIPRLILEYASGKKFFTRGAVLGALSGSHNVFQLPLELRESLGLPNDYPAGPYVKRVPELVEYAKGLENIPVPAQLSVDEAASLFEVWTRDKALHTVPDDELFMSKYTEASGNARNFVWKGLLSTLTS